MAEIVLAIGAQSLATSMGLGATGVSIAGAIGTVAGAAITSSLRPGPPTEFGPRLSSMDITGSEEGSPIPRIYGPEARVDRTQLLWKGPLIENKSTTQTASKNRARIVEFSYYIDVAIAVCEGPVENISKIRANGKVIYDVAEPQVGFAHYQSISLYLGTPGQTQNSLMEAAENPTGDGIPTPAYRGICYFVIEKLSVDQFGRQLPTFSVELSATTGWEFNYPSSGDVVWDESTDQAYIYDPDVIPGGWSRHRMGYQEGDIIVDSLAMDPPEDAPPGTKVLVFDDALIGADPIWTFLLYDSQWVGRNWGEPGLWVKEENTHYDVYFKLVGTSWHVDRLVPTSTPFSPNMMQVDRMIGSTLPILGEEDIGKRYASLYGYIPVSSSNWPGAVFVYEGFGVTSTGAFFPRMGQIANNFSGGYTTGDAVAELTARSGLSTEQVDVSQITSPCHGILLLDKEPIGNTLTTLSHAYGFRSQVKSGKLVFFPQGKEQIAYLGEEDIGTQGGEKPGISITDVSDLELPRDVNVQYIDRDEDYTVGSQRELRVNAEGVNSISLNLPITMTGSDARSAASRLLWETWSERRTVSFSLGPRWVTLQENDVAVLDWAGTRYHVRITQIKRGFNYQHDVKGVIFSIAPGESSPPVYLSSSPPAEAGGSVSSGGGREETYIPPVVTYQLMDLPPLVGSEFDIKGVFYAQTTATTFKGGTYNFANDPSGQYEERKTTNSVKSTMGTADTVLPTTPSPNVWDEASTLDITLVEGVLYNSSKQMVLAGSNMAVVGVFDPNSVDYGFEIIGFARAESLGGTSYRLSTLIRGRRNTQDYVGRHTAGEDFILLTESQITFLQLGATDLEVFRYVKYIPVGAVEEDVEEKVIRVVGNTTRPFSPSAVKGNYVAGDWHLGWNFRSRVPQTTFNGFDPVNPEGPETSYLLTFYTDSSFDTVAGTQITSGTSYTFTSAAQTTLLGSPQTTVYVSVEQRIASSDGGGFSEPLNYSLISSKQQRSTLTA